MARETFAGWADAVDDGLRSVALFDRSSTQRADGVAVSFFRSAAVSRLHFPFSSAWHRNGIAPRFPKGWVIFLSAGKILPVRSFQNALNV